MPNPPHNPSLETLYRQHHGWLQGWLLRRLGNHGDAADLAQDAFVRLIRQPRHFPHEGSARAYLRTLANGLCIDLWRRKEIERAWLDTLLSHPEAHAPSPEQQLIVIETLMEASRLLRQLPAKVAQAFIMAHIDGMKYREIAAELAVSERMVKKYMAQAMLHFALLEAQHMAALPSQAGTQPVSSHLGASEL